MLFYMPDYLRFTSLYYFVLFDDYSVYACKIRYYPCNSQGQNHKSYQQKSKDGAAKRMFFSLSLLRVHGKAVILQAVGRGNGMKNELIIKT